jgi:hypothetical protein
VAVVAVVVAIAGGAFVVVPGARQSCIEDSSRSSMCHAIAEHLSESVIGLPFFSPGHSSRESLHSMVITLAHAWTRMVVDVTES